MKDSSNVARLKQMLDHLETISNVTGELNVMLDKTSDKQPELRKEIMKTISLMLKIVVLMNKQRAGKNAQPGPNIERLAD